MSELENPSAFKHALGKALLARIAAAITEVHPEFDRRQMVSIAAELESLELKARVRRIRDQLHQLLPPSYPQSLKILLAATKNGKLSGFDLWPFSDFIQTFGLDHVELSLKALRQLTSMFSSEFAIRPFILKHPVQTFKFLKVAMTDSSVDIRRWASEGTRPRLPWGEKLGPLIADPSPTLPILEKLKYDDELYVRKNVSNHLNDIAKDHPQRVIDLLKRWQKQAGPAHTAKIDWIIRRALRTLIKNGNPGALALVGAHQNIKIKVLDLKISKEIFKMNDKIEFSFEIVSTAKAPQKLVVDYIIHHRKANQETTPKVFKLKTLTLAAAERLSIHKSHSLKPITTRKYYAGKHFLEIQIDGKIYARSEWLLKI